MKKMSTKNMGIHAAKATLLMALFFFMGMVGTQAQTATQLGADKTKEVMMNLRTAGLSQNALLSDVKTGAVTGQEATDLQEAVDYYQEVIAGFRNGLDLSQQMEEKLMLNGTDTPRFSFLDQDEVDALYGQIEEIKNTKASMQELDDFHTLLVNSKN